MQQRAAFGFFLGCVLLAAGFYVVALVHQNNRTPYYLFVYSLPPAFIMASVPGAIGGYKTFDRLIRLQADRHFDAWRADGSPRTFFATSGLGTFWPMGGFATQRCAMAWLFTTPKWATFDAEALNHLRVHRQYAGWNFVMFVMFVVGLLLAVHVSQLRHSTPLP